MSHMVIFQTPDGNPGYNQFDTVDESVSFVEKLRNGDTMLNAGKTVAEVKQFLGMK